MILASSKVDDHLSVGNEEDSDGNNPQVNSSLDLGLQMMTLILSKRFLKDGHSYVLHEADVSQRLGSLFFFLVCRDNV